MAGVTTKEDVIQEAMRRLPDIDPKIMRDVFDGHISYIYHCANDPNIFTIKLGINLGRMYANYYKVEDCDLEVSKLRLENMKDEFDWRSRVFAPPILAKQVKVLLKNKKPFKYSKKNVYGFLGRLARLTNDFYDKHTKGNT